MFLEYEDIQKLNLSGEAWIVLALLLIFGISTMTLIIREFLCHEDPGIYLERFITMGGDKFDKDSYEAWLKGHKIFMKILVSFFIVVTLGLYVYYMTGVRF